MDRTELGQKGLAAVAGKSGQLRRSRVEADDSRGDVVFADDGIGGVGDKQVASRAQRQCRGRLELGERGAAPVAAIARRALTSYRDDGSIGVEPLDAIAIHVADV